MKRLPGTSHFYVLGSSVDRGVANHTQSFLAYFIQYLVLTTLRYNFPI